MKRSRFHDDLIVSSEAGLEEESELDPLAVALLALGRQQGFQSAQRATVPETSEPTSPQDPHAEGEPALKVPKHNSTHSRRDYVWRGLHRQELLKQHTQPDAAAAAAADGHNSSSRRSSATRGGSSDEDEVAQQQQQQQQQQQMLRQHGQQRQQQQQRVQQQGKQKQKSTKQQLKLQKQQEQKEHGKEWAALTTWLRMNLHHPRTFKRVILFVGHQDMSTGSWVFSLNPGVTWQEVGLETKLRLKTLLVETEQAYQQKYPGRPCNEWGRKVQKYRPPGSNSTADVSLWEVVNGLHSIYLQHEQATDNMIGQQLQQQAASQQQQQQQPA